MWKQCFAFEVESEPPSHKGSKDHKERKERGELRILKKTTVALIYFFVAPGAEIENGREERNAERSTCIPVCRQAGLFVLDNSCNW